MRRTIESAPANAPAHADSEPASPRVEVHPNGGTAGLRHDVRAVARQFQIHGGFLEAAPYGSGHINDTYCVVFDQGGARVRYIFQRINHDVFKDPAALMENVGRVTAHLGR